MYFVRGVAREVGLILQLGIEFDVRGGVHLPKARVAEQLSPAGRISWSGEEIESYRGGNMRVRRRLAAQATKSRRRGVG